MTLHYKKEPGSPEDTVSSYQIAFLKKYRKRILLIRASRILLLAGFLLLWEICARTGLINDFIFSHFSSVKYVAFLLIAPLLKIQCFFRVH